MADCNVVQTGKPPTLANCPLCDGKLIETKEPLRVAYLGIKIMLSRIRRDCCKLCRTEFFNFEQASELSRATRKQYRMKTSLTGKDVTRIRKKLNLSQASLEDRLGLGSKVVIRWENGKVRLPGPVNALFKILDKQPKAIKFV